ncbi:hypothetical protein BDR26DRAFT_869145 [Obelidium mucronatum]|nr:hypothetical protein BDR26DRAFT_869145 [Obelidium mucronatum]
MLSSQSAEIAAKLDKERKLLAGAASMYAKLSDATARAQCEASMRESRQRIEYLEGMLLQQQQQQSSNQYSAVRPRTSSIAPPSSAGSSGSLGVPHIAIRKSSSQDLRGASQTAFDLRRYGSTITSTKVNYRLQEVIYKLDKEQKVKTGIDNLLHAMTRMNSASDPSIVHDLKRKATESGDKITVLEMSHRRYGQLYVGPAAGTDAAAAAAAATAAENRRKCFGNVKVNLISASNLMARDAYQNELYATISIDGDVKYTSHHSATRWDEIYEGGVSDAQEMEICVYSHPGGKLLGLVWFKLSDLEDDLRAKHPNKAPTLNVNDMEDVWLDLEPAGHVLIRAGFVGTAASKTMMKQGMRRQVIRKAFPKNGHKFYAVQSLLFQCAVCDDFSGAGTDWYQCQQCNYVCHSQCFDNLLTKCITPQEIQNAKPGQDLNTGQLFSFRIPHRFQQKTIVLSSWCAHCGVMMGPGSRVEACTECSKCSHVGCKAMVPNFCGMHPDMALQLLAAFQYERDKKRALQIMEADMAEATRRQRDVEASKALEKTVDADKLFAEEDSVAEIDRLLTGRLNQLHLEQVEEQKRLEKSDAERRAGNEYLQLQQQALLQQQQDNAIRMNQLRAEQAQQASRHSAESERRAKDEALRLREIELEQQILLHQQQQEQTRRDQEHRKQLYYAQIEAEKRAEEERQLRSAAVEEERRRLIEEARRVQEQQIMEQQRQQQLYQQQQQQQQQQLRFQQQQQQQRMQQQQQLQQQQHLQMAIPAAIHKNVKLEDFDFLSVLGRGAFGKVMLVEEKTTKRLYAMKALKKENIIQQNDIVSAKLELRIFQKASEAQHPFLVNLHSCFQSDNRLYFVMEYICGGDLMSVFQAANARFSQARTKFYACEVLLALEFFHQSNIIFRDLKLENILMCPDGHIKVADYGICKENIPYGQFTHTFIGTPNYMAPEIFAGKEYGRSVDWWSLGILMFVMLMGRYPYEGDDDEEIATAIRTTNLEFPASLPRPTIELIQGLLGRDPRSRLGGSRLDAEEIKGHPYFAGVSWGLFMEKKIPPPWKPTIRSPKDVSNFDAEFTSERAVLTPMNTVLRPSDQAKFKDFDFVANWAGQN